MSLLCEVFPPGAGMVRTVATPPCAAASTDQAVLLEILRRDVALALWLRPEPAGWRRMTAPLLAAAPFRAACEDAPEAAVDGVLAALGQPVPVALAADMTRLAAMFAAISGHDRVRVRLDGVVHDSCRHFHIDAIGLRLLCTYRGEGTQWTLCGPDCRAPHQAPACAVALLKGTRHATPAPAGCLHRSPPVSRLPEDKRARILLCIDEPGVFA
ncbi:DUF1826 domain-containing protein [Roseomonas sp. CECT 9278]|uniref:DUF1826 domain-containing protein n=1 Tax=Roseomonas sp. CECT 9278 TaxID=2845823 RepID=UPI001E3D0C71|nr:DUF1826 domain-containing protein [Roseomonas sp. CECT 9278]CAH0144041.1 hypothetical protein ROS9278_00548 [Roseomonas sp. CECT 9278]